MRRLSFTLIAIALIVMGGRIGLQVVQSLSSDALAMALGLTFGALAHVPMMLVLLGRKAHADTPRQAVEQIDDATRWWAVEPEVFNATEHEVLMLPAGQGREVHHEVA